MLNGLQGAVWECVLNDTAMLVATASADFSARVWNALSGDEVQQFAHQHIVRTVEFAHHSPRLVTGGGIVQNLLHLWLCCLTRALYA